MEQSALSVWTFARIATTLVVFLALQGLLLYFLFDTDTVRATPESKAERALRILKSVLKWVSAVGLVCVLGATAFALVVLVLVQLDTVGVLPDALQPLTDRVACVMQRFSRRLTRLKDAITVQGPDAVSTAQFMRRCGE